MTNQPPIPAKLPPGTSIGDAAAPDYFRQQDPVAAGALPTQPDPSITPDRIQFSLRMRFNPIRGLTPDLLSQYLDSFRLGFFRNTALAWDAMERRDSRLQTVAAKRKKSVSRHGWEILTLDDSPAAKAQQEFLTDFFNNISVTTALEPDEQGGMSLLLRQMMAAVGNRYAVHEIVWQPMPDGSLKAKFIACPLWWFEGTRGKLRFLQSEFQIYGVEMAPGGWLVTVGDGIMEACSVAYVFKTLTLRDWLNYSERFGTPGILGKTDAAIGSNGWRAMEEALQKFSVDWASVTNPTNDIHLVEAKNGNNQPFKLLVDLMDEEMTRLWRGGDLGTSSKQNSVGASLQSAESEILEVDDAAMLSETLTLKVSRFALNWKFGPHAPQLAYIKVKAAEKQNTQLDLLIDQFLLAAGFPISKASAGERYGRALPKAGGDLLTPTSAPLASANKLAPEIIP